MCIQSRKYINKYTMKPSRQQDRLPKAGIDRSGIRKTKKDHSNFVTSVESEEEGE